MEIYSLYYDVSLITQMFGVDALKAKIYGLIASVAIWVALFILQGFGLRAMAKKRGINNRALAFIPFANLLLAGKIAGDCSFFGQKVKRAGLYTMLVQIIGTLLFGFTIAAEIYLYAVNGNPVNLGTELVPYYGWANLTGFSVAVYRFLDISTLISSIVQLVYNIFVFILVLGVYKPPRCRTCNSSSSCKLQRSS